MRNLNKVRDLVVGIIVVIVLAVFIVTIVDSTNKTNETIDKIVEEFSIPENTVSRWVYKEDVEASHIYEGLKTGAMEFDGVNSIVYIP